MANVVFVRKGHDILLFTFFLCVSFGFWLLQTLNETFEAEITIPLRLANVPDNVVITEDLPPALIIKVRDRGSALVKFYRDGENTPIDVDFSKNDDGALSGRVVLRAADVQRMAQTYLDGGTSHIVSVKPDTLEYFFNRNEPVRLPVRYHGVISTSPQNYLQGVRFNPDSVTVYAPMSMLDTMTCVYTKTVNVSQLDRNTSYTMPIRTARGVMCIPDEVEMNVQVGYYAEKTLEVPIRGLNFPGDKGLRTFPPKAKVTFRVESSKYQSITSDNLVLAVTYEELCNNPYPKYRLRLKSLPDGVSNVRIEPAEVDYLIEQLDVEEAAQ